MNIRNALQALLASAEIAQALYVGDDITDEDVYHLPSPLDLTGLSEIAFMKRPDLHYPPHPVITNRYLKPVEDDDQSFFAALRARDILVHHPYESFSTSVQAFLEHAANDPKVLAIKQTLYRTSGDSPIVDALIAAAEAGATAASPESVTAARAITEARSAREFIMGTRWQDTLTKSRDHSRDLNPHRRRRPRGVRALPRPARP